MKIGRKFTLWIVLVVFATGILSTFLFFKMETARQTKKLESLGNTIGGIVEKSLENYMIARDFTVLDKTLRDLGGLKPISGILLLNRDGVVKAATDRGAVGRRFDIKGKDCKSCHDSGKRGLYLRETSVFRWVQPIANKPECARCHGRSVKNNGVLMIDFSVAVWEKEMRKEALMGFSIFLPSLAIIGIVMLSLSRAVVIKRLDRISTNVKRFKDGDYSVRTPVEGDDEISRHAEGINEMAETIFLRETEIRRNYDRISAINKLLGLSLDNKRIDEILHDALDIVLSVPWLSRDSRGAIFLADSASGQLLMKAHRSLPPQLQTKCGAVPFGRCLCGTAALTGEMQFDSELRQRHVTHYEGIAEHGHYCCPIIFSGSILGVITLYLDKGHRRDNKEEEFLKAISNVLAGIIQRKAMEEERENLIKDLQTTIAKVSRSQKMWQETFDSIGDLISVHDSDFNIIKINKAFAAHFGIDPKEAIHRKCYEFFHGTDSPVASCPQIVTIRENSPCTREILQRGTGKILLVSTFPFHFLDARFHGTIHIVKDITEEREKETRLIMSERLASLGQMASGIAHEINNPLAAIAGCTEGLLRRMEQERYDPTLFTNYLKIIEEEISRCKSITSGMLSFVRKTTYERKMLDIKQLLDKTFEIIGFQGRLKNVQLVYRCPDGLPPISGSEGELRQVFLALISNALDAMDNRGTLTIETGIEGEHILVKITDNGFGIPAEHLDKIFDPFFTTKSQRGGTGLGLSISAKIISNHGGSIGITSEPNKGTTFDIILPLRT